MSRFTQDMTLTATVGSVNGSEFELRCLSGDSRSRVAEPPRIDSCDPACLSGRQGEQGLLLLNYLTDIYTRIHLADVLDDDKNSCIYFSPRAGLRSINVLPDFAREEDVTVHSVGMDVQTRTDLQFRDFQLPLDDVQPGSMISVGFQSTTFLDSRAEGKDV